MQVKDLMVPVSEYKSAGVNDSLGEVASVMAGGGHRDVLVVNDKGNLEGVITMTDIFMALEPNYKKLSRKELSTDILASRYVTDLFKEYGLWSVSLSELCEKNATIKAAEVMHVPDEHEFLKEEDDLEQAIHRFIVGMHQPLFVKANGTITGVLRMVDVFNEIEARMTSCAGE
ncbi:CBS domain-containing protein [Pseudodesulfovibrio cashew]|uniref:CBS domain-containing protein n=1 Tax=Pseudodesulfovibrio cashew TaxID=2678688 RepID=A0A6I6JNC9_9BACT|nr:CBS domain-containing protein [Pseudodesulfovibrio cashew]QGY41742.1 CBS domain-containing protein [Pseudodesulfovibrio cashew]